MSEFRVALVAEGITDLVIIEAALRTLLPRPFILTLLQPEPTRPKSGTGWCGVFKWCREFAGRGTESFETDPTLVGFDLFIVHADADVAEASYSDGGAAVEMAGRELATLPCHKPCPPPDGCADEIRTRILSWLGLTAIGSRTVLCIPSKASEAWLAAALLDRAHPLLDKLECNLTIAAGLENLPLAVRVKKTRQQYLAKQPEITSRWEQIRQLCTQAERFSVDVNTIFSPPRT